MSIPIVSENARALCEAATRLGALGRARRAPGLACQECACPIPGPAAIADGSGGMIVATLRLDGLRPNPARRDLVVAFSLAHAGDATIELLDVSGRGLVARRLAGLAAGDHLLSLGDGAVLPAGVYVIRLSQDGRRISRKAVVAR